MLLLFTYNNSYSYSSTTNQNENSNTYSYAQHVAPYLGECTVNSTTYLIWEASGEYTLEDYIEMEDGWVQLAIDLGMDTDPMDNGGIYDGDDIDAARSRIEYTYLTGELESDAIWYIPVSTSPRFLPSQCPAVPHWTAMMHLRSFLAHQLLETAYVRNLECKSIYHL